MSNEKQRAAKEAVYEAANKDITSVCSGRFFIKNRNTYEECKHCQDCFKHKEYANKKEDALEVHYHYIDNFRKCEFYKYKPKDESYILTTAIYNILYVNDLACMTIVDLLDFVKNINDKQGLKIFKALRKRQKEYDYMINKIVNSNMGFLAEYNSCMDDKVKPKLKAFRKAIENLFIKNDIADAEFLAYTEVMRTLVGYSVLNVKNRITECLKYNKDSVNLQNYMLSEMKKIGENFSKWMTRKCKDIDLNADNEVIVAYRDLDKTLTNAEIINESLIKAREQN